MNHLLAKLKGRDTQIYKVLADDADLFTLPNLENSFVFEASYKLENEEWYKLQQFSTLGFVNPLVGVPINTTDFSQLLANSYQNIEYFCCIQQDFYFFQRVTPSQIIKKQWFYISEPKVHKNEPIMCLATKIDAVYDTVQDCLFFRDLSKITRIFQGIESIYREATQQEVDSFISQTPFITLSGSYTSSMIKSENRKRIALVADNLNNMSTQEKQSLFSYIKDYCSNIQLDSSSQAFVVDREQDLKDILFGIDERYHTTSLSQEKRCATSIKKA